MEIWYMLSIFGVKLDRNADMKANGKKIIIMKNNESAMMMMLKSYLMAKLQHKCLSLLWSEISLSPTLVLMHPTSLENNTVVNKSVLLNTEIGQFQKPMSKCYKPFPALNSPKVLNTFQLHHLSGYLKPSISSVNQGCTTPLSHKALWFLLLVKIISTEHYFKNQQNLV